MATVQWWNEYTTCRIYISSYSISFRRRAITLRVAFGSLLEEKLYMNQPYPSHGEIVALAETSNVFDFLHNEPDIYTLEDKETQSDFNYCI